MTFAPEQFQNLRQVLYSSPSSPKSKRQQSFFTTKHLTRTPQASKRCLNNYLAELDDLQDTIFDVWDQVTNLSTTKILALGDIEKDITTPPSKFWKTNERYLNGKQKMENKRLAKQQEKLKQLIAGNKNAQFLNPKISDEQMNDSEQLADMITNFSPSKTSSQGNSPSKRFIKRKTSTPSLKNPKSKPPSLQQISNMRVDQILSKGKRAFGAPFDKSAKETPKGIGKLQLAFITEKEDFRDFQRKREENTKLDIEEIKQKAILSLLESPPKTVGLSKSVASNLFGLERKFRPDSISPRNEFIFNQMKKFQYGSKNDSIKKSQAQLQAKIASFKPEEITQRARQLIDQQIDRKRQLDIMKLNIRKTSQRSRRIDNVRKEGFATISQRCHHAKILPQAKTENDSDKYLLNEICTENSNFKRKHMVDKLVRARLNLGSSMQNRQQEFLEKQINEAMED